MSRDVWTERFGALAEIVERGKRRGELRQDTDTRLLLEMFAAPLYFRLFIAAGTADDAFLDQIVDFVVDRAARRPRLRERG